MKEYRIVPSNAPVTSVNVVGRQHHYFHSEKLGKCRLMQIAEDENLASVPKPYATKPESLGKGAKLKILMDCSSRLQTRIDRFFNKYLETPYDEFDTRAAWWDKYRNARAADLRVIRKMVEMLES